MPIIYLTVQCSWTAEISWHGVSLVYLTKLQSKAISVGLSIEVPISIFLAVTKASKKLLLKTTEGQGQEKKKT